MDLFLDAGAIREIQTARETIKTREDEASDVMVVLCVNSYLYFSGILL